MTVTTFGVEVFEHDGTPGASFPSPRTSGSLTVLAEPGSAQRVAWLRPTADGLADELTIVDATSTTTPLVLGPLGAVSIAAAAQSLSDRAGVVVAHPMAPGVAERIDALKAAIPADELDGLLREASSLSPADVLALVFEE